jgi:predicted nuclease of restriction endonuclease-like (RecB) superfamily
MRGEGKTMTKKQTKGKTEASVPSVLVPASGALPVEQTGDYGRLVSDISGLLELARRTATRSINSILTATYWKIGRRIVEFEQYGKSRAAYGEELLTRLSKDLSAKYGRGFSWRNLYQMRLFYMGWEILQTPSAKLEVRVKCQTPSGKLEAGTTFRSVSKETGAKQSQTPSAEFGQALAPVSASIPQGLVHAYTFPLSWSHYVRLMAVHNPQARGFYESEAIRGGWSVRQLDRQVSTQFYERAMRSKRPAALLARGQQPQPEDALSVEEEIRDPYLLEFLDLKDEYSENDLEEALIRHLEWFLLEMGAGFTFVARQKRMRIGDSWYRIDLLLYHRGLRCLVVIELKTAAFTHADAGQMNLYLNYAREHLMMTGEVEPVGIILCTDKDDAVVKYATGGIRTKVFASKYLTYLPDVETLRQEILRTQRAIQARRKEEKTDA